MNAWRDSPRQQPKLTKYLIGWIMLGNSLSSILGLYDIIISGKNVV